MAATSVTGRGPGSADGFNKGSEHMTLGAGHLIGPRVVAADEVVLDGSGDATVELPLLDGVTGDYIVTATSTDVTGNSAVTAVMVFGTGSAITLKGDASDTVVWSIIKKGLAI